MTNMRYDLGPCPKQTFFGGEGPLCLKTFIFCFSALASNLPSITLFYSHLSNSNSKILSYVLSRPFVFPFFAPFPIFWCTAGCGAGLQSWWCRKKGRFVIQPEPANKYQEHTLLLFSFSFSFSDSILSFFSIPWNLSLLISINFKNE